jgi:hypothetical protein
MFHRFRRLYLTSLEELRNWGFVGGSIDSLLFLDFSVGFFNFCNFVQFQKVSAAGDQSAGQNP